MSEIELKLKQASAVLGVRAKDLQNLVQFDVVRPQQRGSIYWFDTDLLLAAKVAFYLKEALGPSTVMLARLTAVLSDELKQRNSRKQRYLWLRCRPARARQPIEVRIPIRELARELEEQLPVADTVRDLPRGRKRPGWNREVTRNLEAASSDLSGATETEIAEAIRAYRSGKRQSPEITVGGPKRSA